MEKTVITKAVSEDIDSISELYDAVNTYFSDNVNYCFPNWQKGKISCQKGCPGGAAERYFICS